MLCSYTDENSNTCASSLTLVNSSCHGSRRHQIDYLGVVDRQLSIWFYQHDSKVHTYTGNDITFVFMWNDHSEKHLVDRTMSIDGLSCCNTVYKASLVGGVSFVFRGQNAVVLKGVRFLRARHIKAWSIPVDANLTCNEHHVHPVRKNRCSG